MPEIVSNFTHIKLLTQEEKLKKKEKDKKHDPVSK